MAVGDPVPVEKRFDGMYGEVYRDGLWMADVIEVSGTTSIDRRDLPIAGTVNTQYKRGRVTREGTMRIQQLDDRWHKEFFDFTSKSLAERRAARDAGNPLTTPFDLHLVVDDPEAFGRSSVMLYGVVMWGMPLGFSINDLLEREIPITWVREEIIDEVEQPNS